MELNSHNLNDLNIKIQEYLFNKSSKEENIPLETLIGNLFLYHDNENECDILITVLDKLFRWEGFKNDFINLILSSDQNDKIFLIKSPLVKNYFVDFVKRNLDQFYQKDFLYNLIKIYLVDDNSGVFEKTLNLLVYIYTANETYRNYLDTKNYFLNLITYLENIRGENSIILIRELEIILEYLNIKKENEEVEIILKNIARKFTEYDLLTQMAFLDTLEKKVMNENLASLILNEINIFQLISLGENISSETLRKFMYTISKLYASKFIKDDKIIKNYLSVSLQYYQENQQENHFIMSVILNSFHNKDLFSFLMDPNNNNQFDFKEKIIETIVNNYYNHDPIIKIQSLEVIEILCNFSLPSSIKEQFLKKVLEVFFYYEKNRNPNDEKEAMTQFVNQLYKDFRTHDFEEYESQFLETILSLVTFEPLLKIVLSTFDLILYLLNRRIRPQEICLKKFQIIQALFKSNYAITGGVDKNIMEQFSKYVSKGPY